MTENERLVDGSLIDGRFEIIQYLGEGGFGITYKARDIESSKFVAIKEFFPGFCAIRDAGGRIIPQRGREEEFFKYLNDFKKEADALSSFDNQYIVAVNEILDSNNSTFIIMDFIEGVILSEKCKNNTPLTTESVMLIAEKLLNATIQVHQNNYLHRDIKPGNIILKKIDEPASTNIPDISKDIRIKFGHPVLLDFGSAREARDEGRTMTGISTPHFGAPEQSRDRERQDARTDIYGLGATLYYCLAGELPQPSLERESEDRLVPAQQRFAKRAPASFLRAIDRALQLRPEYRPASVVDFRDELFAGLNIPNWPRQPSDFDPPGPQHVAASYGRTTAQPAQQEEKAKVRRFDARSVTMVGVFVVVLLTVAVASWSILAPSSGDGSQGASEVENTTSAPFDIDRNVEVAVRQMQIGQSIYGEISNLEAGLSEFERTPGLEGTAKLTETRIGQLKTKLQSDKQAFAGMLRALVEYAAASKKSFTEATERMKSLATENGDTDALEKLEALNQIVLDSSKNGTIDDKDIDMFWIRQTEILS